MMDIPLSTHTTSGNMHHCIYLTCLHGELKKYNSYLRIKYNNILNIQTLFLYFTGRIFTIQKPNIDLAAGIFVLLH